MANPPDPNASAMQDGGRQLGGGAHGQGEGQVDGSGIFKVGVRAPPFYPEKPAVWFAQVEGQFAISKITQDATKYYYIISQLEPRYAAEVEDILTNPPESNKYDILKSKLIERLSYSQEQRIKQVLDHEELGDRKPSQFLRHLQNLAGPTVPKDFLRTLWASRLPQSTQAFITSQPTGSLDDLAQLADKLAEIAMPNRFIPSTSAIHSNNTSALNSNNKTEGQQQLHDLFQGMQTMQRQISELSLQVASLSTANRRPKYRSGNRQRSYSRSHSRGRNRHNNGLCYYHNKFGESANSCKPPCNYKFQGNGSSSR